MIEVKPQSSTKKKHHKTQKKTLKTKLHNTPVLRRTRRPRFPVTSEHDASKRSKRVPRSARG